MNSAAPPPIAGGDDLSVEDRLEWWKGGGLLGPDEARIVAVG